MSNFQLTEKPGLWRIMGDYGGLCLFIRLDKLSHIFGLNPANLSLFAFQNAYTLRKIHIFKFLQMVEAVLIISGSFSLFCTMTMSAF